MFSFLKPKPKDTSNVTTSLKLSGLHCTSCALNIDITLEDLPGVKNSKTNYQKQTTEVQFDPQKTSLDKISQAISDLGYQVLKD